MSLFDTLQKKLGEEPAQLAPQQKSLQASLRAKSGKATAAGGPAASNMGEQTTMAAGQTALDQGAQSGALQGVQIGQAATAQQQQADQAQANLASQGQLAREGMAAQRAGATEQIAHNQEQGLGAVAFNEEQRVEMFNATADSKLRELASERNLSVDNIFRDFERSSKDLAFRKDAAELEQLGFTLSMRDKAYMDELNRIGAELDLKDKMNFQDEMTRVLMGEETSMLMDDLGFKSGLNADQRTWNEQLASMDLDAAMSLAAATTKDEMNQMMWQGGAEAVKTGTAAYYKYGDHSPPMFNETDDVTTGNSNTGERDYTDINEMEGQV